MSRKPSRRKPSHDEVAALAIDLLVASTAAGQLPVRPGTDAGYWIPVAYKQARAYLEQLAELRPAPAPVEQPQPAPASIAGPGWRR